ncbi:MAG: flagellar hook assembly protein FlgD [Phycisphaerae bacterium]
MEILPATQTVSGSSLAQTSSTPTTTEARSTNDLSSDDFFQLLIQELTNQDPLEPMDNQDLLNQINSIREIESSTALTETLESLTNQGQLSSVSSLIGQYVTAQTGDDGLTRQGMVVGVRFENEDSIFLQLADGSELSLQDVQLVESPQRAADRLVGSNVTAANPQVAGGAPLSGEVTGVGLDPSGDVTLQLLGGENVRLVDVIGGIGAIGDTISKVF